jgi:hypothetical protein
MPRKPTPRVRSEVYVVQIEGWDWSFTYSADPSQVSANGPLDLRYLMLSGFLLKPKKAEISLVELTIVFDPRLDGDDPRLSRSVGQLDLEGRLLRGLFAFPNNVASSLLTVLAATNKLRFAMMKGAPLVRRQAQIRTIRFDSQRDDEGAPEAD